MSQPSQGLFSALLPAERRATVVVAAIAMCRMFGLFALLPVLAGYSAGLAGATPLLIGIAVGGYGLTQAALQVPFGALSDRIGRIPVILGGLGLFAAGSVLAALSTSIDGVIAGRLLQGGGAVSATLTALLADATRAEIRTRTMAVLGIGIGVAFLLALIAGPLIAAAGGVRTLFWMAAALAVVGAALLGCLPALPRAAAPAARAPLGNALLPRLLTLDLSVFLLHAMLTASFVALPFVLTERLGLPLTRHWTIYVSALLLSIIGTVLLIAADERQGKRWTLTAAVAALLAGQVMLVLAADSRPGTLAALALFFVGFNFLEAALPARLSIAADDRIRGAALGLFASSQFAGAFAGGLAGGLLLGSGRPALVFAGCAALATGWLASLLVPVVRRRKAGESAGNRGW
ncbi:MAG: MFS transporter [Woeseiaceae bacterium]|nr:MFS transporter [Woeseiaceae bacterium]